MKYSSIGFLVCLFSSVILSQAVRKDEEVHRLCRGHDVREKVGEACAFLAKRSTEDKRNQFFPLYRYENRNYNPFASKFGQPIRPLRPITPSEPMRPISRDDFQAEWGINERKKRQDLPKELLDKCCYVGCTYYDFQDVC